MKKIMVIGVSSGVGKSSFARALGKVLSIEVTHLDRLYWKPGWVEVTKTEFIDAQKEIVKNTEWIIEGNYTGTFDIREPYADTIIYLELPLWVCLYRVFKRRVQYHGRTREDIGEGCIEKIDYAFLKFILTTYRARKDKMVERLQRYRDEGKVVYSLRSKKQMNELLKSIQ